MCLGMGSLPSQTGGEGMTEEFEVKIGRVSLEGFSTAELIDELISRGNSIHNIPESVGFARVITGMSNNRDDPSNHLDNPKDLVLANVYLGPCRILVVRE